MLFISFSCLTALSGEPREETLHGIEEEQAYMLVLFLILRENTQYLIARKLRLVQYY